MPTVTIHTPDKLIFSENGIPPAETKPSSSQLDKLLTANASVAVWLVFFAIGGGIFTLYYAHIGYVPEMEWKASLVYLFIGSIVGGVLGLLLTMSLYLPGVIWSETIVFDPCLRFSYATPPPPKLSDKEPPPKPSDKEQATELCLLTIFKYLGLPFLLVLLLSHVALLFGRVKYWLIAGILLVLTFYVMRSFLEHRLSVVSGQAASKFTVQELLSPVWSNLKNDVLGVIGRAEITESERHEFKLAAAFTLSVFLNQISMYVVYWLSGSPATRWTFLILMLLCIAAVWIACHVVALRHQHYPRQAIVASLVTAGLLLFTADNFSRLSVRLMNNFGVGYYKRVNLLVNEDGKDIVDSLGVPRCGDLQLCNVEILSKMGEQYYLRVGDTWYVTLPKADVIAVRTLN